MNKKGFTLIELLAVIVILAIIALIATPIVLNIINESKESANLRSAEMYVGAVETSIATSTLNNKKLENKIYNILENGNICLGTITDSVCSDEMKVEVKGETPSGGKISISDGEILYVEDLQYKNNKISTGFNGDLIYSESRIVCRSATNETKTTGNIPEGKYLVGDEYKCKVDSNNSIYTFFVLSINEDDTVNLLMDRNIYYDTETKKSGLVIDEGIQNVMWQESGLNTDGPVTIMNSLYNATKDWDYIPNIRINYTEDNTITYAYGGIITEQDITKITNKDGIEVAAYKNLKTRLPYKSEIYDFDTTNHTNLWMYNYLNNDSNVTGENLKNVRTILGYWTLTSYNSISNYAYRANFRGIVDAGTINLDNTVGMRPVIILKKQMLEE